MSERSEQPSPQPKSSSRRRTLRALFRFLAKLAVVVLICYILLTYFFGVFLSHSNDMFPAVRDGDLCLTYRRAEYRSGDIVVYSQNDITRFGRIVGMSGDVIDMDADGHFTVNGSVPFETVYYVTRSQENSPVQYPYTVGEDELFLLNDLRDNGQDSRQFGGIKLEDTQGSLVLLLRRRGW